MEIRTLGDAGTEIAIHAMRNPMDSWGKSDSRYLLKNGMIEFAVGDNDRALSVRLQKAGAEHCKHLRMIVVWANIVAPRFWWNEFDTYRNGVEKVSCSTMHRMTARPLTLDDFEVAQDSAQLETVISYINFLIDDYKTLDDAEMKRIAWDKIIQILPQSYLQKRTVMMSYAALRNIYRQREGHKLKQWQVFREWVESLPESWMITE